MTVALLFKEMKIKNFIANIKQKATSGRGRSVLTFMIFLIISTIFWFMMTLNETIQRDYRLEVNIVNVPENTTFLTEPMQYIEVSVRDKGRALIKYDWGKPPKVNIKYEDFIKRGDNRVVISQEMLGNNIRNSFGSGCEILSIRPDSINLIITTRPGERLPIFFDINASTAPQYVSYGRFSTSVDSVTVYSLNGVPESMANIRTEPVSLRNLTDSTTLTVHLVSPMGMRVIPSEVTVTIPVEPLVAKTKVIPVKAVNVPRNMVLHTFPATVELSYLVPMSLFKNDDASPVAIVDYNKIDHSSTTATVTLGNLPDYYHNCATTPTEVEYLVERSTGDSAPHSQTDTSANE